MPAIARGARDSAKKAGPSRQELRRTLSRYRPWPRTERFGGQWPMPRYIWFWARRTCFWSRREQLYTLCRPARFLHRDCPSYRTQSTGLRVRWIRKRSWVFRLRRNEELLHPIRRPRRAVLSNPSAATKRRRDWDQRTSQTWERGQFSRRCEWPLPSQCP